jgi:hypothetical protein
MRNYRDRAQGERLSWPPMWHETQDVSLWLAKQRMAQLRSDAAQAHGLPRDRSEAPRPRTERRFSGLHLHLGRLLIVVGRTLTDEDAHCPDPACT